MASPGLLNVYVYHPEQRSQWGDHFFPDGTVTPYDPNPFDFGPDFVPRSDIIPDLDRWYCYEYMVQANTPGDRDGRIAFWFDGQLAADFHNLRLRDIDSLTIDRFGLSFHIGSNSAGATHKWYDNVVAATSYIGPMFEPGGTGSSGGGGTSGDPNSTGAGSATGGSGATDGGGTGSSATGTDETDGTSSDGSGQSTGSSGCSCATSRPPGPTEVASLLLLLLPGRRFARSPVRAARASPD